MDVLNAGLRGPFAKPMRSPFAPGAQTPIQRAIAVLRKFGPDAHIYLPGVGMLNGLQAGNFIHSNGTGPGEVDQPVGLVLDAAGSVGVELVTNGDFSAGLTGYLENAPGYWSVAAGRAYHPFSPDYKELSQNFSGKAAGPTYRISFSQQVVSGTAQWFYVNAAGVVATKNISSTNPTTELVFSDGIQRIGFSRATGGAEFYIDNISIREVTGIHAQQPTTSAKPILRQVGGRYSWGFDGTNDSLSLGGPLFQMADDHCVVAGGLSTLATGDRYFLDHGSSASSSPMVASLALAGTLAKVYWRDDANVTTAISGGFVAQGSVAILSARKVSTTGVLRVNGQQVASAAIAAGATTLTGAAIGTRVTPANMLAGQVYPVIAIKGTVSDSDLLLLEKLVGQMAGVTI